MAISHAIMVATGVSAPGRVHGGCGVCVARLCVCVRAVSEIGGVVTMARHSRLAALIMSERDVGASRGMRSVACGVRWCAA